METNSAIWHQLSNQDSQQSNMNQIIVLVVFVVVFVAISVADLPTPPVVCSMGPCLTEHKPVCGRLERGGQKIFRTFANQCELRRQNCYNPTTKYVQQGATGLSCYDQHLESNCSAACPLNFLPVCGLLKKSGQQIYKSFSNSCQFWQSNCQHPEGQFVQKGRNGQSCECLGLHSVCSEQCPDVYLPVCGLYEGGDGQRIYTTFDNECKFEEHNCRQPQLANVRHGAPGQTCRQLGAKNVCAMACNRSYLPECGERTVDEDVERRTFANHCLLVQQNCRYPAYPFGVVGDVGRTCEEQGLYP